MTSSSQTGAARGGLRGSIGRLFGGGRKLDASDVLVEEVDETAYPAATESAETAAPADEAPEAPPSEETEEDELVLGPSLKASGARADAGPDEAHEGLVLGAAVSEEPAEEPGSGTGDAEPEEKDILARLRALREVQGETADAAGQQQAAPSEEAWATSFGAAGDEPAEEWGAETGSSGGFGKRQEDAEEEDSAEPEGWSRAEDVETAADAGEGAEDGRPTDAGLAPESTGGAEPRLAMQDAEDAAAKGRPWSEEESGDEPVRGVDEEGETGPRGPGVTEPGASETEPATGADEEPTEEAERSEVDASGAEGALAEVAEPEATAGEDTGPSASVSEADEPSTGLPEAVGSLAEGLKVEESAESDAAPDDAGEPEQREEAPSAAGDEEPAADEETTAPAGSEVATFGAAVVSEDSEAPGEGSSDQAAGLDETQVEEIVRRLIREELEGELGERLSANIRRVVREEVARALSRNR